MGTESNSEQSEVRAGADATEPSGLSATAFAGPAAPLPRTPRALGHPYAVELVASARRHLREGSILEARRLFGQAAHLEREVLRQVTSQPERSLVAEFGARAALQDGLFTLAKELARKGLSRASEPMQWSLHLVTIEAEILELLEEFEHGWQVPWAPDDEKEVRIAVTSRSGRRFVFIIDPDVPRVAEKSATPDEVVFVLPDQRPEREELEAAMSRWMRPRRRAQPVLEQRGLMEHFLLDPVPV